MGVPEPSHINATAVSTVILTSVSRNCRINKRDTVRPWGFGFVTVNHSTFCSTWFLLQCMKQELKQRIVPVNW